MPVAVRILDKTEFQMIEYDDAGVNDGNGRPSPAFTILDCTFSPKGFFQTYFPVPCFPFVPEKPLFFDKKKLTHETGNTLVPHRPAPQRQPRFTDGNSGIGYAAAEDFAANGATVVITGRNPEKVASAAARLGVTGIVANQADLDDLDNLVSTVKDKFGKVDVLFVNAGIFSPASHRAYPQRRKMAAHPRPKPNDF